MDPKDAKTEPATDHKTAESFDVTKTKEYAGIIKDLQGERQARQEFEGKFNQVSAQLQEATARLSELEKTKDDDTFDADDLVTAGKLEQKIKDLKKEIQDLHQQNSAQQKELQLSDSEEKAKAEYTVEKCGEGLDWDSVVNEGLKPLVKKNPALLTAIRASSDPGKIAYDIGKTHPTIAQRAAEALNAKLVLDLQKKTESKKTGESALLEDITEQSTEFEKLMNMSEEELLKSAT